MQYNAMQCNATKCKYNKLNLNMVRIKAASLWARVENEFKKTSKEEEEEDDNGAADYVVLLQLVIEFKRRHRFVALTLSLSKAPHLYGQGNGRNLHFSRT